MTSVPPVPATLCWARAEVKLWSAPLLPRPVAPCSRPHTPDAFVSLAQRGLQGTRAPGARDLAALEGARPLLAAGPPQPSLLASGYRRAVIKSSTLLHQVSKVSFCL